jgi:hypothetical protein
VALARRGPFRRATGGGANEGRDRRANATGFRVARQ